MPAEDDISIAEKRVYAGSAGRTDVYLAAEMGLVRVAVSGDKIGEFGIAERASATDVAVVDDGATTTGSSRGWIALATETDLLTAPLPADGSRDGVAPDLEFAPVGLGATTAVGVHDGAFLAATADGGVWRMNPASAGGNSVADAADGATTRLGTADDPVAVDGPLVAAADGVHRVVDGDLESDGLADVRDVAGAGVPLAATAEGLFWLGNGWMDALAGGFRAVAADGDDHALAVDDGGDLSVHTGEGFAADAWTDAPLPVPDPVTAVAYGPGMALAATDAGALCVDVGDGWRHRTVGVRGVRGIAAVRAADGR